MEIELLPTKDELLCNDNPSFFPNIIKGEYPDVSAYLDIHYSLLREDFIRPVREAISSYKKNPRNEVDNLAIFPNIQFGQVQQVSHEIGIQVQFSTTECEDEDWENSKSFLRGSLVLFTYDGFKNYFLGTILQRDILQLKQGKITVQLHGESHFLFEFSTSKFLMAECKTFFLPYCNIMRALRTLQENTFPFCSEFIFAHRDSFLPEYLDDLTEYSLPNGVTAPVLDMKKTVTADMLDLNDSQFSAVVTALNRRIALIQGPPGTGKTHVGTKIAEILLKNSQVWNPKLKTPILITCASNQALDQFAERLLKFTDEIIRVGEQSKSRVLEKYKLNVILKGERSEQTEEMKTSYRNMMISWDNLLRMVEKVNNIRERGEDISSYVAPLVDLEIKYSSTVSFFKRQQQKNTEAVISRGHVLAMTTTQAAHMNNVLQKIKPPIVIVEEAAEMFEAHVIASLTNHCKHLILIGDHQQLRPIAAHPLFARQTNLDVSLFERLINNGVIHEVLLVQHRMRPEIANLLTQAFYENLTSHSSTTNRQDIIGMKANLFFMTHKNRDQKHSLLSGFTNHFEAEFSVEFAKYLVSKGHSPQDITIITPYTLQARLICKFQLKSKMTSGCIVTTIDGFQGQESKIILISWVRNGDGIGFLGNENRVCVALSRARDGLYMIGDLPLLMQKSSLWKTLGDYLHVKNLAGDGFSLDCTPFSAKNVQDFPILKNL